MKKLMFAAVLLASPAVAQEDNFEMARMGITMNDYACERVIEVVPTNVENVVEITCQEHPNRNKTVVYIFTIEGAGFTVTPK